MTCKALSQNQTTPHQKIQHFKKRVTDNYVFNQNNLPNDINEQKKISFEENLKKKKALIMQA